MDNPRPEKVAIVDEVRQRFDESDAAILSEYRGLKVKDLAQLRRTLRADGGEHKIYKNTLVRFAVRDAGLSELEPLLEGPTAITFVRGDAATVAKSLRDYARTNPMLVIKGGVLGGTVLDAAGAAALADLPSREVLLARFAGALAAPLQQLAGLLQALPRNLAYGLAALRDQRVAGGEALPEGGDAEPASSAAPASSADSAEPAEPGERTEPEPTEPGEPAEPAEPEAAEVTASEAGATATSDPDATAGAGAPGDDQ